MKNVILPEFLVKRTRKKVEDARGAYFRDQTAIIHSMPFRRLKHKTQVFFAPQNDHVCTRIEHVMHVATIAKTICKGLNIKGWQLNDEMAYAIGIGHDLGHAPFGHDGERILNHKLGGNNAFVHEVNSYKVVEHLANNGTGLNLTYAVKDGILCHNGEKFEQRLSPKNTPNKLEEIKNRDCKPTTYEGCIVRFSDKIAYLGRDIEDAIVAGFITRKDIPTRVQKIIGSTNSEFIDAFTSDIVKSTYNKNCICLSDEFFELFTILRKFNYENIYFHPRRKEYNPYAENIIITIYDYLLNLFTMFGYDFENYQRAGKIELDKAFGRYLWKMNDFYKQTSDIEPVVDYIAGMTDLYAVDCMKQITIPKPIFKK